MVNEKCVETFVDTTSLPSIVILITYYFQIQGDAMRAAQYKSMPDDHSKLVPPLPIPNRTVKRFYADDSAATSVKVGYRQASYIKKAPSSDLVGAFFRLLIRMDVKKGADQKRLSYDFTD